MDLNLRPLSQLTRPVRGPLSSLTSRYGDEVASSTSVDRRHWIFVFAGALLLGTTALLYERTLPFWRYVECRGVEEVPCSALRTEVLGVVLSPIGAVAWSLGIGAAVGALLGFLVARARSPARIYSSAGAVLMGAGGFLFGVSFEEFCIVIEDTGTCPYNSFLGWAVNPMWAVLLWTR